MTELKFIKLPARATNLTGKLFEHLLVIGPIENAPMKWLCICKCGTETSVRPSHLIRGNTISCGCENPNNTIGVRNYKHGMSHSRTYTSWTAMKQRCNRPDAINFCNYGGRGISYDPSWESFGRFYSDMGICPKKHSIERKDNALGYSKENCEWATKKTQSNNMRSNRMLTFNGVTLTLSQWADRKGIRYGLLNQRINRGWSVKRALTTDVRMH